MFFVSSEQSPVHFDSGCVARAEKSVWFWKMDRLPHHLRPLTEPLEGMMATFGTFTHFCSRVQGELVMNRDALRRTCFSCTRWLRRPFFYCLSLSPHSASAAADLRESEPRSISLPAWQIVCTVTASLLAPLLSWWRICRAPRCFFKPFAQLFSCMRFLLQIMLLLWDVKHFCPSVWNQSPHAGLWTSLFWFVWISLKCASSSKICLLSFIAVVTLLRALCLCLGFVQRVFHNFLHFERWSKMVAAGVDAIGCQAITSCLCFSEDNCHLQRWTVR